MKKIAAKIFTALMVFGLFSLNAQARTFPDIGSDYWAKKEIECLSKDGVVVGYPDGTFKPDQPATRAEFATMVIKALWQENSEPIQVYYYKDVPKEHWAYEMIQKASDFDLLSGYPDGTFEPNKNLKKAEAISIVISSVSAGEMAEIAAKKLLSTYKDSSEIPAWAVIPAGKAEKFKLIAFPPGSENHFKPDSLISRAEIAVTLYNMRKQALLHPNKKLADALIPKTATGKILEKVEMASNGIIAVIPEGTILEGALADELVSSQKDKKSKLYTITTEDHYVTKKNYLLFPKGTNICGEIVYVKKAMYFVRNAKLETEARRIVMQNGNTGNLDGCMYKPEKKPSFFSKIFRTVVKGKKINIKQGQIVWVKLLKPVRVDVTKTIILDK